MILSQMIGLLTPPVGTVIFVLQAIAKARMSEVFWGSVPFMVPLMLLCLGDHLLAGRDPLPAREAGAVTAGAVATVVALRADRPRHRAVADPGAARAGGRAARDPVRLQGHRPARRHRRPRTPGTPAGRGDRARLRRAQRHPPGQAGHGAPGRRGRSRGGSDRRTQHGADPRRPDGRAQHRRLRVPRVVRRRPPGRRSRASRAPGSWWRGHRRRARARRARRTTVAGRRPGPRPRPRSSRPPWLAGRCRSRSLRPLLTGSPPRWPPAPAWSTPRPWGWRPTRGRRCRRSCCVPDLWLADIVYRPLDTALLTAARRAGCTVLSGAGMAVHQAADSFELFTGLPADRAAMLSRLRRARGGRGGRQRNPLGNPLEKGTDDGTAQPADTRPQGYGVRSVSPRPGDLSCPLAAGTTRAAKVRSPAAVTSASGSHTATPRTSRSTAAEPR